MPANSTHPEYDIVAAEWLRARDVLAGEDAVKRGGEKYLPRLDSQSVAEYDTYRHRASFFNATARTAEGFIGLILRRPPFVKVPESKTGAGGALAEFVNDADMLGTPLPGYTKNVVSEVIGVGRAGSLVDWSGSEPDGPAVEKRAYVSLYTAEQIINWQVERVNGRNVPTLVVLLERNTSPRPFSQNGEVDSFVTESKEQIRVLKLVPNGAGASASGKREYHCSVEIWRPKAKQVHSPDKRRRAKIEWELAETITPLRLGKPLPLIPFVFHGPRHSQPDVDRPPLTDIITVNLDHYRLDADFKHGLHFTALPTAWVSGFDKKATLQIGSSTAWVASAPGATAGFLEFTGQGLTTFERAMDRDERLMSVLGSRLLGDQKKVGETAEAIRLRQSGEDSVLNAIATSVSESLTQVLRWVFWWNSTEELPDSVTSADVLIQLNTDFSIKGMSSQDLQALVAAWQAGAISLDTMLELFRKGEILPDGRSNQDEAALLRAGQGDRPVPMQQKPQ